MTNEEAARILDPETTAKELRKYGDGNAQIAACDEACRIAAKNLRSIPTGDPLTLEQLREMDGHPVWCVSKIEENISEWMIVDLRMSVCEGREYIADFREIGDLWLAYAYPPARIDREEWEPCTKCKTCASCTDSIGDANALPCLQCEQYSNYMPRNFCPDCGRPLTPEAWDMLEKRLRG